MLLLTIFKVFEILVYDRISPIVSNFIFDSQHGFVKNRSTVTNLVNITQFAAECVDAGLQCDVIYTDVSKAFDRLNQNLLCTKLISYGFAPSLVKVIRSFLTNRKLYVFFMGYESFKFIAKSGVPQGSILGPLLRFFFYQRYY